MLLSCCVVALDVVAYLIYNWNLVTRKERPFRATWGVWFFVSLLNSASYLSTSGDIWKSLLSIENTASCGITFASCFFIGRERRLKKDEWWTLGIGIVATMVWWFFRQAFYANTIMQFVTIASSLSFMTSLWKDPKIQRSFPWFLWSVAYVTNIIVVMLRWDGHWQTIVYPANYAIFHILFFVLTLRKVRTPLVSAP